MSKPPSPSMSRRTSFHRAESDLARAIAAARADGQPLFDLTVSNPTRVELPVEASLLRELGEPRGAEYTPLPFGHPIAREAAAADAQRRGAKVDAARVVLSASTSESYGWLFSLLCDRGDNVLMPRPSYPLFEWLARLAEVELRPYPLMPEQRFGIDLDALERAIDDRTRAILLVSPNNPTGTFVRRDEADAIEAIAERHGLALIVDEVFGDYAIGALASDRLPTFLGRSRVLSFVLDGLSKKLALPQLKVAWTIVDGPEKDVEEALARLEVIADTFLSVGTPQMLALPALLQARPRVQAALVERLSRNRETLDTTLAAHAASVGARRLPLDGGWSAIVEVPRTRDDESWCTTLLTEARVLVQPGYFYDFERPGQLVVSLLPEPATFAEGARRMAECIHRL